MVAVLGQVSPERMGTGAVTGTYREYLFNMFHAAEELIRCPIVSIRARIEPFIVVLHNRLCPFHGDF